MAIGSTGNSNNSQIDTDIKAAKYDLDNKADLQTLQKDFNKLMQDAQNAKQNGGSSPAQSDEMKKILEMLMQVIQQLMQSQGGGNQDQSQSPQTVQ